MLLQEKCFDIIYCNVQDWKIFVHVSIMKHTHPLELRCTEGKWIGMFYKQLRFISGTQFGSCWKKYNKVHVSSLLWYMSQSLNKQDIQKKKNCVSEFPILSTLKITFMCTCGFYNDMNTYKGISKHSWKKIVSCFGQLLLIY